MAQLHASIGAGPTLHSHRSPSRLAGPGPIPGLTPSTSTSPRPLSLSCPVVVALVSPHAAAPDLVAAHCLRYCPGGPRPRLNQLGKSVIPTTRTNTWRAGSRDHTRLESPVLAGAGATRSPARRAGLSAGLSAGPQPPVFHVERVPTTLGGPGITVPPCRRRARERGDRRQGGRAGSGTRRGAAWLWPRIRSLS